MQISHCYAERSANCQTQALGHKWDNQADEDKQAKTEIFHRKSGHAVGQPQEYHIEQHLQMSMRFQLFAA